MRDSFDRRDPQQSSYRDERDRQRPRDVREDSRDSRDYRNDRDRDSRGGIRSQYRDGNRDLDRPRSYQIDEREQRLRGRREPSPPLLRFASSSTTFVPPPPRQSFSSHSSSSHRNRPRSRSPPPSSSTSLPPAPIYMRIGSGSVDKIVGSASPASGGGGGAAVPLIRIVGGGADKFGLNGNDRRRDDRSPPSSASTQSRPRARSPPPVSREPFMKSANPALPLRPIGSPPQPASLLSRINGLPDRPPSLKGEAPSVPVSGGGGGAKRIRDPEQIIREAEMKKRRGL